MDAKGRGDKRQVIGYLKAIMTDAIRLANAYVDLTKQSGITVDKAYLFGSYAKGKVWDGSDIDICIISKNFGKDYWAEKSKLNKLALRIDPKIEPIAYSPADFQNKYDSLTDEIQRFGILLTG